MPNTPHDLKFRSLNLATFHVLHTMLFTPSISVSYNTAFLSNYALSMTTSIYIVNICITLLIFYVGMCGMDFSSSVRFRFGFDKNRGFGSVSVSVRF